MNSAPHFPGHGMRPSTPVMPNWLKRGAALALSLGLVACGGASVEPARVAQARFSGMETLSVSRISVLDQDGRELYAQRMDCETQASCRMELLDYSPPEQLSFKLYNADAQLVSVSDVYRTDRNSFALSHSDTMLGTYLFRTYAARYAVSPLQLSVQLATFFQAVENLDGTPDHFNELGRLYQTTRQDPERAYGELAFYAELKKRLDQHEVLRPDYMPADDAEPLQPASQRLMAAASTDTQASCPGWLQAITEVAGEYGKFIPYVGEGVGKFMGKALSASAGAACDQSDKMVEQLTEINSKLDEIQEQLHELDAKVVALGYRVEQLQKAVYDSIQNTALGRFYDDYNKIVSYTSTYHNMLNPLGKAPYTNLSDYVQKNGGLKQSKFGSETALYALLRSMAAQNQSFKGLALKSNLDSLANAFRLKCEKTADMSGNVAEQRGMCNLLLATITAQFSEAQNQLALLMKDEVAMVHQQYLAASSSDKAWIELTFVSPFIAGWDGAQTEVNNTLKANLEQFGNALGNSFVPVLQDLPTNVNAGLSFTASCRSEDETQPAISAWFPNNDKKPYAVVHCYNAGRMVKSKFYYNADDAWEKYKNILGVPVVERTSGKFTDRSTTWTQTGSDVLIYNPSDEAGENGLAVKLDPKLFAVNNQPLWPKWIMEPYATHIYAERCDSPACKETVDGGQRYVMKKLQSADGIDQFTSRLDATKSNYDEPNDYIAATVSYTVPAGKGVESGTTLVWQVELRDDLSKTYNYAHPYQSQWRLRCLTADCSASDDHLVFENNDQAGRITLEGLKNSWKSFVVKPY
jgi:hypothetical protein